MKITCHIDLRRLKYGSLILLVIPLMTKCNFVANGTLHSSNNISPSLKFSGVEADVSAETSAMPMEPKKPDFRHKNTERDVINNREPGKNESEAVDADKKDASSSWSSILAEQSVNFREKKRRRSEEYFQYLEKQD